MHLKIELYINLQCERVLHTFDGLCSIIIDMLSVIE